MSASHVPEFARGYEHWPGPVGRTVPETQRAWPRERRAADASPNVVVVLIDDMGYSDIGPYGSEIATPNLDRLAARGVRLTNYHTTPVCSPARAAALTGLNPHRAGYGSVANSDPGLPNLRLELDEDVLALPEILRSAGYATFGIGKWHLTRDALMNDAASKGTWPVQRGFDQFYGTLEGCNSFFHPNRLVRDNSPIDLSDVPDHYYLTDDLTDNAIALVKGLRASDSRKPFFLYFAHHAMHGPLGAKPADLARYRGAYDRGWDEVRRERLASQLAQGLFPPGTALPPRNAEPGLDVPAWGSLPAEARELYARHMEVYAAMVDSVDQSVGRVLDTIEAYGELDNTIVVFTSDNGGTAEGGRQGTRSYFSRFVHVAGIPGDWEADVDRDLDLLGGPQAMIHYPRGWGMASNTPFRLYKGQTYAGGVRVPFLLSWPAGMPRHVGDDGLRHQYQYVTDLVPTLLDLVGVEHPGVRNGAPAKSVDGFSFRPVIESAVATSTHADQYAEFGGSRGYYSDGWKIVTNHRPGSPFDDSEWELYHVETDPTELHDLAAREPVRLRRLAARWEDAAWANTVFPLVDGRRLAEVRRPAEAELEKQVRLFPGTPKLERYRSSRLVSLRSFAIDVLLDVAAGDEGVLVAHGDQGGGYLIYLEGGALRCAYNEYGRLHELSAGTLVPGPHHVRWTAQWLPGFRWSVTVDVDGVYRGSFESVAMLIGMAPFSGIDIGINRGGPVSWPVHEAHRSFPYTGRLESVTYTPGDIAPYSPALVAQAEREVAAFYD